MKRNVIALICMALVALAVFVPAHLAGMPGAARPVADVAAGQAGSGAQQATGSEGAQGANEGVTGTELPEGANGAQTASESAAGSSGDLPEHVAGEMVVGLADGVTVDQLNARLAELDYVATKSVSEDDLAFGFVKLDLAPGVDVTDAMARMADESVVASAEPNYVLHAMETSASDAAYASTGLQAGNVADWGLKVQSTTLNDTYASEQWGLGAVHAYEAWDYMRAENAATPVTVAVIDTGMNVIHEDFDGSRIVGAKSIVNTTDDTDVTDVNGHGTHVAGIIAATANNNKGIAGVSYNARIMPVQIMDADGKTDVPQLIEGLEYVVEKADKYNIKVINLSLGSDDDWTSKTPSEAYNTAINAVHEKGILVVYAAGNHYETLHGPYKSFPVDFDETAGAIGVIALAKSESNTDGYVRVSSSNCNKSGSKTKDLSAPGSAIKSTERAGYTTRTGTSMAAPHVAGIAAMLFAADPSLTPAQVEERLEQNVTELGNAGWDDDTGYGLVNAEAALKATSAVATSNPTISGPDTVGKSGGTAALSITNSAGRAWTWASSDPSIATVAAGSDTAGATVTGVETGTATITATSDDHIQISHEIQVVDAQISGPDEVARGASGELTVSGGYSPDDWTWTCSPAGGLTLTVGSSAVTATGVNAGTYTVTATNKANAGFSITHEVTVAPTNMSSTTISGVSDQTYTGAAITFSGLTVTQGSGADAVVLSKDTDYTVAYSNNVNAGTATITVTGTGNYTGTKTATFKISPAALTSMELLPATFDYTGLECNPGQQIVYGPKHGYDHMALSQGVDYTLNTPSGRVSPGTYTYTATGAGNYTGTVSAQMTIVAPSVKSMSLSATSFAYDGTQKSPTVTVKDANGRTMIAGVDYTLSEPQGRVNVDTYTYTVTPKGAYAAYAGSPLTATMTITQASMTGATVTLSPTSYTYDGKPKTPATTVMVGSRRLAKGVDYTVAYANNTKAGTATVTVTGKGNYKDAKSATFTIKGASSSSNSSSSSSSSSSNASKPKMCSVQYRTHVQNVGWQGYVRDGATAGTSGRSLRLEGINISLVNAPNSGGIQYRTHVQNIGWQGWVSNGKMAGTSGRSLRLEAIQIQLTGQMAANFDVYYRVHCQNIGWMGWARNGAPAGTAGFSYRLEAIQIKVVPKGSGAPGSTYGAFRDGSGNVSGVPDSESSVLYRTHVQNVGWQNFMRDGEVSGTSGRSLRLEGINIKLGGAAGSGGIEYRTHVQNIGWQGWARNGSMSGTSGRSLRLEAIQIRLTGAAASKYDVYYRVHCQNIGWMGWAKNGASAGTAGYSYRLEAIQIKLVPKNGAAPGPTSGAFRQR